MRGSEPVGRRSQSIWVVLLLALLVVSGLGLMPKVSATPATPPAGVVASAHLPATAAYPSARPAANTTISTYQNDSNLGNLPTSDYLCFPAFGRSGCYIQAQDPTVVTLANGQVGDGFSILTSLNSTNFATCPSANFTATRVAFEVSPDNGTTFGSPTFLPTPASNCTFVQQLEPTFAVSGNSLWGAYVSTNATPGQLYLPGAASNPPILQWVNRSTDGIAIVNSTDNGSTFGSASLVLNGANYAKPMLTSYGKTLYLLYEDIANGSSPLPLSGFPAKSPIAEKLLYSADNGVTWNGPYVLPGENSSQFNNTMGGSISVSRSGVVAVAYATNRSCVNYCFTGSYAANAEDVVVVTSVTNGSTWSSIHTVAFAQGEDTNPYAPPSSSCSQFSPTGTSLCDLAQNSPMTTLQWGLGGNLYVAWEATRHRNVTTTPTYAYDYNRVEIYAGASSNGGGTWSYSQVSPRLSNLTISQGILAEDWFNPALGYSAGTVYLTFSYVNWSSASGYQSFGTDFTTNTYSQWVETSTNGLAYSSPSVIFLSTRSFALAYYSDMGDHSSVGFSSAGSPLFSYALSDGWFVSIVPGSYDFLVTLSVSSARTGPTTTVTFVETGLAPGTAWSFAINGAVVSSTQPTANVSGVPIGAQIIITWPGPAVPVGYRALEMPVLSAATFDSVGGPTTIWFNFTTFFGIAFSPSPNDYYLSVEVANYGSIMAFQDQFTWDTYLFGSTVYYYQGGTPMPWYLASGTHLHLSPLFSTPFDASYYTQQFVGYWNGTGAGSYTGAGSSANLTVSSPFNESLWDLSVGTYSEQFSPVGLPASSTYSFAVDGVVHSAAGTAPVIVANLTTGAHSVTNITATSTRAGWEYFGTSAGGNPLLVPIVPHDNLTFAFVNTTAAAGLVSFHAIGVTAGSAWRLTFNGTVYSSTTPWINITTRPGTFPVGAGNVVSANGTAALTPTGFGPLVNVTTSQTYDVNFTGTYELTVLSSTGGTVSPTGSSFWLAPNAYQNLTAAPATGFGWGGWTGTGPGSYSGLNLTARLRPTGPVQEAASFVPQLPNRFNLTLNETGLPTGTEWSVFLNGKGYSSSNASFEIPNLYSCALSGALGNYAVFVPTIGGSTGTQYLPESGTASTACVVRPFTVIFTPQFAVTVSTTAGGTISGGDASGVTWVDAGATVVLQEFPNAGYSFLGWTGTGTGSVTGTAELISVSPAGPVTEVAAWAPLVPTPAPRYSVTFSAGTSLPVGTSWSVVFNGSSYSSTTATVAIPSVVNGSYTYSVPTVGGAAAGARYQAAPPGTSVNVRGAASAVSVPFSASYWVQVTAVGPGTVTATPSGWVPSGHTTVLNASPSGSGLFEGWAGTGNGSYSGPAQGPSVRVSGPISEVATFLGAPASTTTPGSSSAAPSTLLIAGLAVIGLVAGVAVGVLVGRRGRPPASSGGSP